MTKKTKIILVISGILLDIALIVGAFFIGKNSRYKGVDKLGQDAIDTIEKIDDNVNKVEGNIDLSIDLLNPTLSYNFLTFEALEKQKEVNHTQSIFIDNIISLMETSQKNIDNFMATQSAFADADEFASELILREVLELERIRDEYNKILNDFNKVGE